MKKDSSNLGWLKLMALLVTFMVTGQSFASGLSCSEVFTHSTEFSKLQAQELYDYPPETVLFRAQTVKVQDLNRLESYLDLDGYKGARWSRSERLAQVDEIILKQGLRGLTLHQLGQRAAERLTLSTTQDLAQITHIERYGRNDISGQLEEVPSIRILAEIRPDPKVEAVLFLRKFAVRDDVNETGIFDLPKNVKWYVMTGQRDAIKIYKIMQKDILIKEVSSLSTSLVGEKNRISLRDAEESLNMKLDLLDSVGVVSRDLSLELTSKLNYYSTAVEMGQRQDQNGKWHYSNSLERIVEILTPFTKEVRNSSDSRIKEAFKLTKHSLRRRLEKSDLTMSTDALKSIENWIAD